MISQAGSGRSQKYILLGFSKAYRLMSQVSTGRSFKYILVYASGRWRLMYSDMRMSRMLK